QEQLYWHARKMVKTHADADDILQNTFIKAWKNIEKFRGDAKLKTWLYRIATNESLTFLNKQKKQNFSDLADIENELSHSQSGGASLSGEEIKAKLDAAVERLPDKQRLVFVMKYFEEMKYQEIADVLGGSVGSLKASFHHAVKKIESFLLSD
ncbi:MAG TPA: RNA polymerase sigma factor, partial [Bacteroidetes bacterium]|nr:RNA polymerase sigma factor [Bacteroidota bacterium]